MAKKQEDIPYEILAVSYASDLAKRGKLAQAQTLLENITKGDNPDPSALDLLAKIFVQQGKFNDAVKLWQQAIRLDPDNFQYKRALKRAAFLSKHILWINIIKKSTWILLCLFLLLISISLPITKKWFLPKPTVKHQVAKGEKKSLKINGAKQKLIRESKVKQRFRVKSQNLIIGKIEGLTVKREGKEEIVIFKDGLFSLGRASLSSRRALTIIDTLADIIKNKITSIKIVLVEGHTCDLPVKKGSIWFSNYELGLKRAQAVVNYFVEKHNLPRELFIITSTGKFKPLFPNISSENRAKNRTVVIKVIKY